jgi:prepilin-type N-terminal cleavage/methylation domain-containing protein/prepilin-type processing-associated H-X9-DG protein
VKKSDPATPMTHAGKTVHSGTKNDVPLAPATSNQALARAQFGQLYHFLNSARSEDFSRLRICANLRASLENVHHWPNCRNAIECHGLDKKKQSLNARGQPVPKRSCSAFTVIELMVAIGVIGILAALILPALSKSKLSARATGCINNLRQIGLALQLYADENDNRYPTMFDAPIGGEGIVQTNLLPTVDKVLVSFLTSSNLLRCPSDSRGLFEQTGCSYAWNPLVNGEDVTEPKLFNSHFDRRQIPLFFDREAFHREKGDGHAVNYLYADGHVQNELVLGVPKSR